MPSNRGLLIANLLHAYRTGQDTPAAVMQRLLETAADERHVWITRLPKREVMAQVAALDRADVDRLPLYGIPFVIKDNIDLAGTPTTAGCPEFAYTPARSAFAVQRLIDAGAIPLGKTNLDQFATGLVGTRSPYGECRNSFNDEFISGGSSSGSAVAVATGLASFALGTDTAGSGRVPAAFNNIVGLKPSNGRLSTRGVVPACRSLDCVSVFALTAEDAATVLDAAAGHDDADPYSRPVVDRGSTGLHFGVPRRHQLQFFGDTEYARLFEAALRRLESLGGTLTEVDFEPFLEAARLLYEGPWIAERYAAVGSFIEAHPGAAHPITRQIIEAGKGPSAAAAFQGEYTRRRLLRQSEPVWSQVDFLVTPTTGTIYRRAEIEAEPLRLNANLGYYTNFMNLFDLAGVAVPAGFRADGLPFGITLIGPRGADRQLLSIAGRVHRASVTNLGATNLPLAPCELPTANAPPATPAQTAAPPQSATSTHTGTPTHCATPAHSSTPSHSTTPTNPVAPAQSADHVRLPDRDAQSNRMRDGYLELGVCGAHMQGLPLNHQLLERGGLFVEATTTAPSYRLFALPGGPPRRPGMMRVHRDGARIHLEVWSLPKEELGSFIAAIPAPLGVGKIELDCGAWITGFLCEGYASEGADDITRYGGWRDYVKAAVP